MGRVANNYIQSFLTDLGFGGVKVFPNGFQQGKHPCVNNTKHLSTTMTPLNRARMALSFCALHCHRAVKTRTEYLYVD